VSRKKIYIVAGNLKEFEAYETKKRVVWTEYSKSLGYEFPDYVYVGNAWQLKGLDEIEGYYIGSYKIRPDLDEIEWCIKAIKGRQNNVDNLKGIVAAAVSAANGGTGVSSNGISSNPFTSLATNGPHRAFPQTISTIGTSSAVTQYSYPNPDLEQRTKALEEALEWIKKQIESAAP